MILGCVFAFFSPGSGLCSVLDSVYMIVVDESSRQHRLHTRNTISTRTRRKYLTPVCLPVHVLCCIFMKCVCLGSETRKTNHIIQNGMMLIQQQQNAQEAVFLGRSPLLYRISLEISLWVHDVTCGYWIHTIQYIRTISSKQTICILCLILSAVARFQPNEIPLLMLMLSRRSSLVSMAFV